MHYEGTAYARGNTYTIQDLKTRRPVERNTEISPQDFELLNIVYPGEGPSIEPPIEQSVLVLNSKNTRKELENGTFDCPAFKPAVMIDSAGNTQESTCFKHDCHTEAYASCSISWKNEMIIFGGYTERRQISRLEDFKLKRIGSLNFDFFFGACSAMNNEFIYLCFPGDRFWSSKRLNF